MGSKIFFIVLSALLIAHCHTETIDEAIQGASYDQIYLSDSVDTLEPPSADDVVLAELDMAIEPPCRIRVPRKGKFHIKTEDIKNAPDCDDVANRSGIRKKRNAITGNRWPMGRVPFEFDDNFGFTQGARDAVARAVAEYDTYTCVSIVEKTPADAPYYVRIIKDGGCYSFVGRVSSGSDGQRMSLVDGCLSLPTIAHEFMHALGIHHEHNRFDRDEYIRVNTQNIRQGLAPQFTITEGGVVLGTNYDYRSVMHYGKTAFSISRSLNTIDTLNQTFTNVIGNSETFSFKDLMLIHAMYSCDAVRSCPTTNTCPSNSYRGRDCQCWCANTGGNPLTPAKHCDDTATTTTTPDTTTTPATTTAAKTTTPTVITTTTPTTTTTNAVNKCRRLGKRCGCERFENGCHQIPNTECKLSRCVCANGYYKKGRTCEALPPPCTTLEDTRCKCWRQPNPCSQILNSECKKKSGCRCACGYNPGSNNTCVVDPRTLVSDGSEVLPFRTLDSSLYNIAFQPIASNDPTLFGSAPFGVPLNGFILQASSLTEGSAALITPLLKGRTWRISFMHKLVNAEISLVAIKPNKPDEYLGGVSSESLIGAYFDLNWVLKVPKSYRNFKLRIEAAPTDPNLPWSVNIDPLKMARC